MNSREINKILSRIRFWNNQRSEQLQLKKGFRNDRTIREAEKRISILKSWLKGTVVHLGGGAGKSVAKAMSKDEFKKLADVVMKSTVDPGAVMVIHDRKTLDQVYDRIKMANIQISAPPHVLAYYREKLRKERPYKQ